jgi:hypothetical protein
MKANTASLAIPDDQGGYAFTTCERTGLDGGTRIDRAFEWLLTANSLRV